MFKFHHDRRYSVWDFVTFTLRSPSSRRLHTQQQREGLLDWTQTNMSLKHRPSIVCAANMKWRTVLLCSTTDCCTHWTWSDSQPFLIQKGHVGNQLYYDTPVAPQLRRQFHPSVYFAVLFSSKTHNHTITSGSPVYFSIGSFILRVLWSISIYAR